MTTPVSKTATLHSAAGMNRPFKYATGCAPRFSGTARARGSLLLLMSPRFSLYAAALPALESAAPGHDGHERFACNVRSRLKRIDAQPGPAASARRVGRASAGSPPSDRER